ncbi:MAG: selenocysteine-specific translation elongation factor [Kiritimatiellia bacterium]
MTFSPPGSWRPESLDVEMMVCTAGHVDHGKTSLVKWLTGCETDVLKEEKERGMTIEPGFAPCTTAAGVSVGITDVPGHERFVHHMVAGVSGVGMCILVIAADDGIMPQTIEHFQIMELLGVERGVVALTKMDLVDAATRERRIVEIRAWLANGFLKDAPICPVSSETGEGILEFHRVFSEAVAAAVRSEQLGIFRLPIERVFSMEGHGRVLSGVPVAGRIAEGEWVELVPGGAQGRVRGMQCFGRSAEQGRSGLCVALNVPDFARADLRRGQVLCLPGRLRAATVFHSRLRMLDRTGLSVKSGERVMLHTGTAEVQARVYGLESKDLAPGSVAWVALVADEPLAAAPYDRYILRKLSPVRTLGGGRFDDVVEGDRRPRKAEALERMAHWEAHYAAAGYRDRAAASLLVEQRIEMNHPEGVGLEGLLGDCLLAEPVLAEIVAELERQGKIARIGRGLLLHRRSEEALRERLGAEIRGRFEQGERLLDPQAVGARMPPEVKAHVLGALAAAGEIERKGHLVVPRGASSEPAPEQALAERICRLYAETGFNSPRPEEVPERLKAEPGAVEEALRMLVAEGRLIRVSAKVLLAREHMAKAQETVAEAIRKNGQLDSGDFKFLIGSTRKYALGILEYMDRTHVTARLDSIRKLAPNYEKRMLK